MAALGILKEYAKHSDPPKSLSSDILFAHTDTSLTIYDAFPKAQFHFLLMPRLLPGMQATNYKNLHALLQADRSKAHEAILSLQKDSKQVVEDIEEEMVRLHGYKWKIWVGFHAVPSMDHLHMHIISSDLCSPKLKNKKHYNSFRPDLGFFLHLDDVLEWFEGDDSYFQTSSSLQVSKSEALLKGELECWRCHTTFRNIPTLKSHLEHEWNEEKKKATGSAKRKRQEETNQSKEEAPAEASHPAKRHHVEESKSDD